MRPNSFKLLSDFQTSGHNIYDVIPLSSFQIFKHRVAG